MKKKIIFYSFGIILLFFPATFVSGADSATTHAVLTSISEIETHGGSHHQNLEISNNGNYIYASGHGLTNNYFYQFDNSETNWNDSRLISYTQRRTTFSSNINDIATSDDGDVVFYCETSNGKIFLLDNAFHEDMVLTITGPSIVQVTGNGEYYMYVYHPSDYAVTLSTTSGGSYFTKNFVDNPTSAQIANDGSFIALGFSNGSVQCFSKFGSLLWSHDASNTNVIKEIDISKNGKYVIANVLHNCTLYLYNSTTGVLLQTYKPGDGYSYLHGISTTGNEILVSTYPMGTLPGVVNLYSPSSADPVWSIDPHFEVTSGSITDDGSLVVCGTAYTEGCIFLIDCASGDALTNHTVSRTGMELVKISGDGSSVVGLNKDGAIFIFKIVTGVPMNIFEGLLDPINLIINGIFFGIGALITALIFRKKR